MTKPKKKTKVVKRPKIHKPKRKPVMPQKKDKTTEEVMDEAVKVYEPALNNLAKEEPKQESKQEAKAEPKKAKPPPVAPTEVLIWGRVHGV